MKKLSASVCAVAVVALLASSLSFAGQRDRKYDNERGHGNPHQRDDQRDGQRDDRREDWRQDRNFDQRDGRWNDRRPDYNARGPEFRRGGYIAREYRTRVYEVDYREHHLHRPPQGQRWVQVGADYVLIAIATGVITNIILNQ
jgi:Ni/Co efflux regulator RcnB